MSFLSNWPLSSSLGELWQLVQLVQLGQLSLLNRLVPGLDIGHRSSLLVNGPCAGSSGHTNSPLLGLLSVERFVELGRRCGLAKALADAKWVRPGYGRGEAGEEIETAHQEGSIANGGEGGSSGIIELE